MSKPKKNKARNRNKKRNQGRMQTGANLEALLAARGPIVPDYSSSMTDWYDFQWAVVSDAAGKAIEDYYGGNRA